MGKKEKFWFGMGTALLVLAFYLLPRLVGLKEFLIVDEPDWYMASANFYYAVTHFDFAKAAFTYHPAVTTMWVGTAAMLLIFPEYRGLGQGYLNRKEIDGFFIEEGVLPLDVIATMRVVQVFVLAALFLVFFFLLKKLFDRRLAFGIAVLLAGEPFIMGHSRVINHEGLLVHFVLISIVAFMIYVHNGREFRYLLLSGLAAGLANLSKSSAMVLFPLMALMLLEDGWLAGLKQNFGRMLKAYGIWLALLVVTYIALWPGMWVAPGKMLYGIYGEAFSYIFRGVGLAVEEASTTNLSTWAEIQLHLGNILLRTTPVLSLGVLLTIGSFFKRGLLGRKEGLMVLNMAVMALGILLIYSVAGGRNSLHYFLLIYIALSVIAALGFMAFFRWVAERFAWDVAPLSYVGTLVLGAILLGLASAQFPYYYTYINPITAALSPEKDSTYGYAEGLELAAEYLSAKENAADLTVTSWYARGPFSYYFPGQVEYIYLVDNVDADFAENLRESDYLVIYYPQQLRRNIPANLLAALKPYTPEKTIVWNGDDYVGIYNLHEMPEAFFDSLP